MKQTAVEFLLENIEILIKQGNTFNPIFKYYFIEEAKEMEKQQQGYNYEKVCEMERFRAIDFAKWFADFNGLTWEEKRVSKEHLDNLYKQYLKTLGGTI
jgi:hypothetical protein